MFGDDARLLLRIVQPRQARRRTACSRTFVQGNVSSLRARRAARAALPVAAIRRASYVSVLEGEVWDVAVDIRRGSPHFGRWTAVRAERARTSATSGSRKASRTASSSLSERAVFTYLCTATYDAQADAGIRWNDARLAIDWPVGDAVAVGQGRARAVPRRRRRRAPAGLRAHEDPAARRATARSATSCSAASRRWARSSPPRAAARSPTAAPCEALDLADLDAHRAADRSRRARRRRQCRRVHRGRSRRGRARRWRSAPMPRRRADLAAGLRARATRRSCITRPTTSSTAAARARTARTIATAPLGVYGAQQARGRGGHRAPAARAT